MRDEGIIQCFIISIQVRWRPVFWGLGLQFAFGLLSIRWPFGRAVLECVGGKVTTFLSYTDEGTVMVYGETLVLQWGIFAFKVSV